MSVKKVKKGWIIALVVLLCLVLIVGGIGLSMLFSYQVAKTAIRLVCAPSEQSHPSNYAEILENTEVLAQDIDYQSDYGHDTLDIFAPKGNDKLLPCVVYIHGGYYVSGGKMESVPYCRTIANGGYIVVNVEYMFAPEAKYPTQVLQINQCMKFLQDNAKKYNIDVNNFVIGGDSAGGSLSSIMGVYYTNNASFAKMDATPSLQKEQLKGLLLLCGFYNADTVGEKYFPLLPSALWMLTGERKYKNYARIDELSPVKTLNENYPSVYMTCGDKDPFYNQAKEMKEVCEKNKIRCDAYLPISNDKKLKHEFQREFGLKECNIAMEMCLKFLDEVTD